MSCSLGPTLTGTLVASNIDAVVNAYCDFLSCSIFEDSSIGDGQAALWGKPGLAGQRSVTLCSPSGNPWLRVVHNPSVLVARPFCELGWLALEVLVADVDVLAERLADSPFTVFRPPVDLDDSDDLRAMQVIGPTGEVLYLTQVNAAVPRFDIPRASSAVDRLFMPVSCCLNREDGVEFYKRLGAPQHWAFETHITSVNKSLGLDLELKHPVATVQLAGRSMVEIDQLAMASPRPHAAGGLPAGIAMVSMLVDNLGAITMTPVSPIARLEGALYGGQPAAVYRGTGGELIELIEAA